MRRHALALALALLAACGGGGRRGAAPTLARGTAIAGVLPLLDGGELDLASLRGRWVAVHIFATWSLDAGADVEELRAAREALGKERLVIVGLALDPQGYKLVAPWRASTGADWLIALATPEVLRGESAFGDVMTAVPTTVLVDPDGRVAWVWPGPLPPGELAGHVAGAGR